MTKTLWPEESLLLGIHNELLARFGGQDGVRDPGMLDLTISRFQEHAILENNTSFELAAAYAFGIVRNHPFIDGNKRIGFMSAYIFLGMNGYSLEAPEEEAVIMTRDLAAGEVTEAEYTAWLEKSCVKRQA